MSRASTVPLAQTDPVERVLRAAYHWRHDPACASAQADLEDAVDEWAASRQSETELARS